jgi:organic hydroperoxide reductase OsmC/OhrA
MSEHRATIAWTRTSADFAYENYNRDHVWHIDGGIDVPASSAPEFRGTMERVDPERALVAALSSCHMLTFLAIAARNRHEAIRQMSKVTGRRKRRAPNKPRGAAAPEPPTFESLPGPAPLWPEGLEGW